MSREIKFRVWDGCKFIEDYYNHGHFISIIDRKLIQVQYDDVCPEGVVYGKPERLKLQQYTGLKDVNGVEIYEGDILEFGEVYGEPGYVYFDDYSSSFVCRLIESGRVVDVADHLMFSNRKTTRKVIGNIHQHPELLK